MKSAKVLGFETLGRGLRDRSRVWYYLRRKAPAVLELLEEGNARRAADRFVHGVTGRSPYRRYLRTRGGSPFVRREIHGNEMFLDLRDSGISYDLLIYGQRESYSTTVFRRELRRLRRERGDVTVVDVGANIGYYLLQEADIVGPRGHVYGFEPVPDTADLLARNVRHNGFDERVTIERNAVGARDGTVRMRVPDASNLAHIAAVRSVREYAPREYENADELDVGMRTLDSYLSEAGVSHGTVGAVRMDVEGYEVEILRGMSRILSEAAPLVLFVECHPWLRETGSFDRLVGTLREHGFELVSAVYNRTVLDANSLEDVAEAGGHPELILRKP
jgi:FkbM family methyltransferase